MLMGAAHNALWAFNARVSLTLPVCQHQTAKQAWQLALRSGAVRSPVTVVPSCGLETRSWRTGRMARHEQECIRLPYTAALASQRAFFVKVLPPVTKERNRERVSCFRCRGRFGQFMLTIEWMSLISSRRFMYSSTRTRGWPLES